MGRPTDLPTTATLQITPELVASLDTQAGALAEVQDYVIDGPEMAVAVNTALQDIKARAKAVDEWDERFAAPIRQLEETRKSFFGPAKAALAAAEAHCKNLLKGWTEKERLRIAAEEQQRKEAARRAREEAEQAAAAAKARADEAARKAREEAARAEAERKKQEEAARVAREAGDRAAAAAAEKKAQAAAAERAKQEEAERQKIAEGERKAAEVQLAAAAAPVVEVREAAKIDGFGMRDNWCAEITAPDDDTAIRLICEAICGIRVADDKTVLTGMQRHDLIALLKIDTSAANKLAKALKGAFNVPGFRAVNKPVPVSRGK